MKIKITTGSLCGSERNMAEAGSDIYSAEDEQKSAFVEFTPGVNFSSLDFSLGRQRTQTWAIVGFSCAIMALSPEHFGVENEINQD